MDIGPSSTSVKMAATVRATGATPSYNRHTGIPAWAFQFGGAKSDWYSQRSQAERGGVCLSVDACLGSDMAVTATKGPRQPRATSSCPCSPGWGEVLQPFLLEDSAPLTSANWASKRFVLRNSKHSLWHNKDPVNSQRSHSAQSHTASALCTLHGRWEGEGFLATNHQNCATLDKIMPQG